MNASALARSRTPPQLSTSAPRRDDPGRRSTNNHRRSLAMRTRAVHREDASASMRRDIPTPRHPAAPRSPPSRSPHPSGPPTHRVHLPRAHSSTTPTRGKSLNKRVDRSSDSRITPRAVPTAGTSRAAPAWCGLTYPPETPASATSSPTSTSSHPTTSHPTRTNKESGKFIFISVWAIRTDVVFCFGQGRVQRQLTKLIHPVESRGRRR